MLNLIGTFREISPELTWQRISPLLLEPFGITRIADLTGLDNLGVHTCVAIRPNAKSLSNSQGKGVSKVLAQVSAAMEAIELWHAENLPEANLTGNYHDLAKQHALIFKGSMYGSLHHKNIENGVIEWMSVTHLSHHSQAFMPKMYFDLSFIPGKLKGISTASSNGLASGNTLAEALCHGLFEVMERDCFSRFYKLNNKNKNDYLVDLQYLPSPECQYMVQQIIDKQVQIKIFDMRSKLNIPAYYVMLNDSGQVRNLGLFGGYGCHFNDEVAMLRAITEAVQSRITYISGARDDLELNYYNKNNRIQAFTGMGNHRPQYQQSMPSSIESCLEKLITTLSSHGYKDMYYLDHTRSPWNIPVVHVMVPDLIFDYVKR